MACRKIARHSTSGFEYRHILGRQKTEAVEFFDECVGHVLVINRFKSPQLNLNQGERLTEIMADVNSDVYHEFIVGTRTRAPTAER